MARFAAAGRNTTALTAARGPSVFATAAVQPRIREVGVFNTSVTAVAIALCRATATGTVTETLTEVAIDDVSQSAVATTGAAMSTDATVTAIMRTTLGAAAGSGVIWTFGESGFELDNATGSGAVITVPTGTAQVVDFYFVWDE